MAVKLFDAELVGAAPIERQNPRRVATAYHNLNRGLHGSWKKKKRVDRLREILRLPIAQPDEAEKEIHQDASLNYKETIA